MKGKNMKTYNSAMLQIVSIKNDIVTASGGETIGIGESGSAINAETAGRRMDDWDAGY